MTGAGGIGLDWDAMVLVGVVTRVHGLRGDVVVSPETDFVEERFAVGATVWARREAQVAPMRVVRSSFGGRRPVVGFEGVADVTAAERLVGLELRIAEDALMPLAAGAFYQHRLVGCRVETMSGEWVGDVVRVDGGLGTSLLVLGGPRGEVLVPFAEAMCPSVDVDARLIRVDAPAGLLDVNVKAARSRRPRRAKGKTEGPGRDIPLGS